MSPKLKLHIPESLKKQIKNFSGLLVSNNLTALAKMYKTDKWGRHYYTPHYQSHFKQYRFKPIKLLEIGVGGYENPKKGGNSLRMWKKYFPFGRFFSIDIYDKSALEENRIKIFQGSQVDKHFINSLMDEIGEVDIIIDDGSHINEHVITSFELLFPFLKNGGVYVVEDTETSYLDKYGGDSKFLDNKQTTMNFFKSLTDEINHVEYEVAGNHLDKLIPNINSIHFYHSIIFVNKESTDEKSSITIG